MTGERTQGRYRVDPGALAADRVRLGTREARHMAVRRLQPGAAVTVFDGTGVEARAELLALDGSGATVRVLERRLAETESPLRLWLVQGLPVKLPRVDDVVRQATELGVVGIVPVIAAHSEIPGGGAVVLRRKADRWRRLAETAAKQCGRARVPEILDSVSWADVPWDRLPEPRLLLDPRGDGPGTALATPRAAASVLVGPEGGWSDAEVEEALGRDVLAVRLGPRVLRADSAGPAALAVIQHLWGDLG